MTVKELKIKLGKLDDDLFVVIEGEKGKKFNVLTVKKRNWSAGHHFFIKICWILPGELLASPADIHKLLELK